MQVRNIHLGDGPQLETSLPPTHPDYAIRKEALSIYASNLYAKLVEYGRANFAPTTDGAYRDLFTHGSPSRTIDRYVHGTLTPEQIANTGFNLVIKIRETDGLLFLVVAPTASTTEQSTLRQALDDTHQDWVQLYGGQAQPAAVVYSWLSDVEPGLDLWPEDVYRPQQETDLFRAVPQA
jgi:hypothetical protein